MIEIDGSRGGGQMLRTALTLSAVRGEDFRMENIRANRSNPGLKRQHLECVEAVKRLTSAEVEGAEMGSKEIVFRPLQLRNQSFTANIGTAGSVTLLLDTVLPISSQFDSGFRLKVKGGTDVKWSPSFNYLKHVKLPLLRKIGFRGDLELEKTGYYPEGGGEVELRTRPHSLEPVEIRQRGDLERFEIYSKASEELVDQDVADRQADEAARRLKNSHISVPIEKQVEYERTDSTGSSLLLKAVYESSIAGFDSLGEKGKRSEEVAKKAVEGFRNFQSGEAAVDSYMADQLLVFMAVVGGEISVPELTRHVQTNMEVLGEFGVNVTVDEGKDIVLRVS
ncbi:MAG: RNA 3'-terminal phosphate cyclase [Candidatus Nanohaloarchaea archaeon]